MKGPWEGSSPPPGPIGGTWGEPLGGPTHRSTCRCCTRTGCPWCCRSNRSSCRHLLWEEKMWGRLESPIVPHRGVLYAPMEPQPHHQQEGPWLKTWGHHWAPLWRAPNDDDDGSIKDHFFMVEETKPCQKVPKEAMGASVPPLWYHPRSLSPIPLLTSTMTKPHHGPLRFSTHPKALHPPWSCSMSVQAMREPLASKTTWPCGDGDGDGAMGDLGRPLSLWRRRHGDLLGWRSSMGRGKGRTETPSKAEELRAR